MTTFTHSGSRRPGVCLLLSGFALFLTNTSQAQVGNDNPSGPAGMFNGNITTACSYDPYTGNARRAITDMVVAGAVGNYGLSFTRTSNSRNVGSQFGAGGGWRHPFDWSIDDVEDLPAGQPIPYTVNFPDGRTVNFSSARQQNGAWGAATPGVRERLKPWDGTFCYVVLPDGGKVQFRVNWSGYYDQETRRSYYNFSFTAEAIIDPHGLRTTFSSNSDGSFQITEPAGRWIKIFYTTVSGMSVIDRIEASDGRSVQYWYTTLAFSPGTIAYPVLTNVSYYGGYSLTASYGYQAPNVGDSNGFPLLASCDDVMYAGPMKRISYTYATGVNFDGSAAVYGQILSENSVSSGDAVSTLTISSPTSRSETRGDGPGRTFNYAGGLLMSSTDFKSINASQTYLGGFVDSITDKRGNTTNIASDPLTGNPKVVTFPLTPPDTMRATIQWNYGGANCPDPNNRDANNPYYLYSVTNERNFPIIYKRYTDKRVWHIDYPDTRYEEFSYNGFGQVLTHRLRTGGTEGFEYDPAGRKTAYRDPYHDPINKTGNPTFWYLYDSLDRLWKVTDSRGSYPGDPAYTTIFEYNSRGQLTRTTFPPDPQDGLPHSTLNTYNPDGTRSTFTDELGHTTSFTYDDYKRLRSVTTPQRSSSDTLPRTTWLFYDPYGSGDDYRHADSNVTWAFTPGGKRVINRYDENLRKTSVLAGVTEISTTTYQYDLAGNLEHVIEPLQQPGQQFDGKETTFGYDERNRRTSATDAKSQTTQWLYDAASNKIRETRPDNAFQTRDYDSMNRVYQTHGFGNEFTGYGFDDGGNVNRITDAKGANYYFGYDLMNRKTSATYPADADDVVRFETWHFNAAGQMDQYSNPANQTKTISYDNRNRPFSSSWSALGPNVAITYDAASRMTRISTNNDETVVAFRYDDANNKIGEDQTVAGYPTRTLETYPDADNNARSIGVTGVGSYGLEYNERNQLARVQFGGAGGSTWYNFTYDGNGNLRKRQNVLQGSDSTNFGYDEINRISMVEQSGAGDAVFARSWQQYDNLNRMTATWRDEQGGKGERFGYDIMGQLTTAVYNADNVQTTNPNNWDRSVSYNVDPLNRVSVNDNGTLTSYTPDPVNQYTAITGQGAAYDGNFNISYLNGGNVYYDAEKRVTSITVGGTLVAQFVYDGLGRCLKRTLDNVTTLFLYHGWQSLMEWDAGGNMVAYNIYGAGADEILTRWQSGIGYLHYHLDRIGNVQFLLSEANAGLEKYTYDAFGEPTVTDWNGTNGRRSSNYGNRFMFTGREYFPSVALYDYRNRFYRPSLGRFLQNDSMGFGGGDSNLFRYCGGDPVNRSDPYGLTDSETIYNNEDKNSGPAYYGSEPLSPGSDYSGIEFPYEPSTGEGATDRVSIGGPPEPGTSWAPGDRGPNDHGSNRAPGDGGRPGGTAGGVPGGRPGGVPGGAGPGGAPGMIPNPYRDSAPLIAEVWKGFDGEGLKQTAEVFEQGATYYVAGVGLAAAGPSIYAGSVIAANVSFDALLYAGSAGFIGYQSLMANPQYIVGAQQFVQGYVPGMGGATAS
jgi:RHS repeat-associated protein